MKIPGGSFMMGSGAEPSWTWAAPAHRVAVKPFELARTPVTFRQYRACVDAGACSPAHVSDGTCCQNPKRVGHPESKSATAVLPASFQDDDHPVVCVDWAQAKAFAHWAGGRLPTEAEWEYAARGAGRDQAYPWGDEEATCKRAVVTEGALGCGRSSTWPVCSKPRGNTAQGLCDMAGNVWEWTQDLYHETYFEAPADGSAWEVSEMTAPVYRGGSWRHPAIVTRAVFRKFIDPDSRCDFIGLRPARSR